MRLLPPSHSKSAFTFYSNTKRKTRRSLRTWLFIAAIALPAVAFGANGSSASSLSRLFGKVSNVFGGQPTTTTAKAATVNAILTSEAVEAPTSSTTMTVQRRGHSATRLNDGTVLIAGGENANGVLNETEIYDPASGLFSETGYMNDARADHTATLLSDGRVLIAGGRNATGVVSTTEIFDPSTGTFSSGPNLSVARAGHTATLFADGRILIAGGDGNGSAEIIDASLSGSSATGLMTGARANHSTALLLDGRVLIVGGSDANGNELSSGEIFDNGSFTAVEGALHVARVRAHLRVLFDGKVQIIGGSNDGSMEIYDPSIGAFGAYAHVAPEGDTCASLPAQVQGSQTRAALFHNGQSDPVFDRSSHTMNELGSSAIVIGGSNSANVALSSSPVFNSSSAAISTDKLDYAPGETAHISGRGFQPGETLRVRIHEDPHTPQERGMDVVADGDGNFVAEYLVTEYDLDMKFLVGARGLSSGRTAQTTFTDSQPGTISLTPTSVSVTPGNSAVYGVNITQNGNSNLCTLTLSLTYTGTPPVGTTPSFSPNPLSMTTADVSSMLTIATTNTGPSAGRTQPGTYNFTVGAAKGGNCQGPAGSVTTTGTLVVTNPNVAPVASAVSISGTAEFNQLLTGNYTYSDADGDLQGASTFRWLRNGTTVVGTNQTYTTVSADVAQTLTFEVTPVAQTGISPGAPVTSAGVVIGKAPSTTTINCPASVTYNGAAQTPCTATATGTGGLNASVTVVYGNNTDAGTATADATYAGDTNHNGSVATQVTFTIDKADSSTTINCPTNVTYDGSPQTPCTATATGAGGLNASVTVVYGNNTDAGTATADATYAGDTNHNGSVATQVTFTIDKRTLTASIINDPTKVYDGNTNATLTFGNFSISNLVAGQNFTVTKTTGTYNSKDVAAANTVSTTLATSDFTPVGGTNPNNYNLPTSASGPGHITAKPLTVSADNQSFLFGDPLPTLTASYDSFVAGEGVANLTGTLVFTIKTVPSNVTVPYNSSTPSGTYTIVPGGLTSTNYAITFANGTLTIGAWTITGFYQPVDMNTPTLFIWNTVKGGSTVPLKFNIYAGPVGPLTERKNVSDVMFGSVQIADIPCNITSGYDSLVDVVTNTGNTVLRYDATGAQFIQNWQTLKQANKCYQVRMTALDGSHIDAYFKTK